MTAEFAGPPGLLDAASRAASPAHVAWAVESGAPLARELAWLALAVAQERYLRATESQRVDVDALLSRARDSRGTPPVTRQVLPIRPLPVRECGVAARLSGDDASARYGVRLGYQAGANRGVVVEVLRHGEPVASGVGSLAAGGAGAIETAVRAAVTSAAALWALEWEAAGGGAYIDLAADSEAHLGELDDLDVLASGYPPARTRAETRREMERLAGAYIEDALSLGEDDLDALASAMAA